MLETNKIHCMEIREALKQMPDEFIDCVITSPPYWALRDYGSEPQIWDGDSDCEHEWRGNIDHPGSRSNDDSNIKRKEVFGKRDNWAKTNFCTKCNAWKGELGLEPTFDLYIKHLCDIFDEIKRVLKKTGTCWVVIGDTYGSSSGTHRGQKKGMVSRGRDVVNGFEKALIQIPSRFAIEMSNRGWILRNEIIWHKPNCMPSSAKDRFTVDFEKVFFFTKSKKYFFKQQFEPFKSKPTKLRDKRNEGYGKAYLTPLGKGLRSGYEQGAKNKRCVWEICPQPFPEAHFAVFPEKLVEPMIKAGCPEKGIVLDPFMGSGTTCVVTKKLGRNYIGIDINQKYVDMAQKRINKVPMRIERFVT